MEKMLELSNSKNLLRRIPSQISKCSMPLYLRASEFHVPSPSCSQLRHLWSVLRSRSLKRRLFISPEQKNRSKNLKAWRRIGSKVAELEEKEREHRKLDTILKLPEPAENIRFGYTGD